MAIKEEIPYPCLGCGRAVSWENTYCSDCEKLVCPECGEFRPDDDRVQAGMKCGFCAYGNEGGL